MTPCIPGPIHIGTSGWSYDGWRGPFYPPELARPDWLAYYARHLSAVETNSSFYRLPKPATLEQWRDAVPEGFVFSVKASRFITHMKKLKDPEATLPPFLECIQDLAPKLGPVLFQLPPKWHLNTERLAAFLRTLPGGLAYAFEFRDPSWWVQEVYDLLASHGVAFCLFDLDGRQSPQVVTGGLVYVRLHGPDGPYQGCYGPPALAGWRDRLLAWSAQGKTVHCYFDNDQSGYAVQNAISLQSLLQACGAPT